MQGFSACFGGVLSLALAVSSAAACGAIVPQTGALPGLNGKVAFQAINGTGHLHLYLYDFSVPAQGRTQIDKPSWNLAEAVNPHLSRNGLWVAFAARSSACPAGAQSIDDMFYQVYVYNLASANPPAPLLPCENAHHEDVKFSSDMGSVVFKRRNPSTQQYSLETLALRYNADLTVSVTKDNVLVQDGVERSAPYLSPTSSYVYYFRPSGSSPEVVFRMNVLSKYEQPITPTLGVNAYYPVVRDMTTVFYARNLGAGKPDQLFMQLPSVSGLRTEKELTFNDCNLDASDPAPVDEDYLLFSRPSGANGNHHELYVGQMDTTKVWSLSATLDISGADPISDLNGASYFPRLRYLAP